MVVSGYEQPVCFRVKYPRFANAVAELSKMPVNKLISVVRRDSAPTDEYWLSVSQG